MFLFFQVGLISDEKLVDLLDLALSADTVNTVKNLRIIMETGLEPLALMSQLATVITDILAGSYDFSKDQCKRKFFRRQPCEFQTLAHPNMRSICNCNNQSFSLLQFLKTIWGS